MGLRRLRATAKQREGLECGAVSGSALYFPYINFPSDPGFLRTLLYWDRMNAMIPEGVRPDQHTDRLMSAGLVAPVNPAGEIEGHEFFDGFETLSTSQSATSRAGHPSSFIRTS